MKSLPQLKKYIEYKSALSNIQKQAKDTEWENVMKFTSLKLA